MTDPATVVDDTLLARVVVARDPQSVPGVSAPEVVTAGLWYYRLARAVLGDGAVAGSLSAVFEPVDPASRRALIHDLPPGVEVVGLPTLAAGAALAARQAAREGLHLDALAAEAVAAALETGGPLVLGVDSPALRRATEVFDGLTCRVVG